MYNLHSAVCTLCVQGVVTVHSAHLNSAQCTLPGVSVFTIGRRLKGDFLHPNIYERLPAKPWNGGRRGGGVEEVHEVHVWE